MKSTQLHAPHPPLTVPIYTTMTTSVFYIWTSLLVREDLIILSDVILTSLDGGKHVADVELRTWHDCLCLTDFSPILPLQCSGLIHHKPSPVRRRPKRGQQNGLSSTAHTDAEVTTLLAT